MVLDTIIELSKLLWSIFWSLPNRRFHNPDPLAPSKIPLILENYKLKLQKLLWKPVVGNWVNKWFIFRLV